MPNPQFIEEKPLALVEVQHILASIEKRDTTLNFLSTRTKEYLENFVTISGKQREDLRKKLQKLNLTRLKEEHLAKIADFLPQTAEELKVVLQAYPLSLPKKDQETLAAAVKEAVPAASKA